MKSNILNFKKVLKYVLTIPAAAEHFQNLSNSIKDSYIRTELNNDYVKMWSAIKQCKEKYNMLPDYEKLENLMVFHNLMETKKIYMLFNDIKHEDISVLASENNEFVSDLLEKYVMFIATYSTLRDASEKYKSISNDFSDSRKQVMMMYEAFEEVTKISFNLDLGSDFLTSARRSRKKESEPNERFPSSIQIINDNTYGGYKRKTLNVIMARTHAGKTMFIVSEVCNILRKRPDAKVLIVSLEVDEDSYNDRIVWNLSGKSKKELLAMTDEEYDNLVAEIDRKYNLNGRLIIKFFPTDTLDVQGLKSYLDKLQKQLGFKPDVCAVDYISIMKGEGDIKSGSYYSVGRTANGLRGVAGVRDMVMLSCMQANREGQKADGDADDIDFKNMADSIQVGNIADILIGAFINERLKRAGRQGYKVLKNRLGDRNGFVFYPRVNYVLQRLWSDKDEKPDYEDDGISKKVEVKEDFKSLKQRKKRVDLSGWLDG